MQEESEIEHNGKKGRGETRVNNIQLRLVLLSCFAAPCGALLSPRLFPPDLCLSHEVDCFDRIPTQQPARHPLFSLSTLSKDPSPVRDMHCRPTPHRRHCPHRPRCRLLLQGLLACCRSVAVAIGEGGGLGSDSVGNSVVVVVVVAVGQGSGVGGSGGGGVGGGVRVPFGDGGGLHLSLLLLECVCIRVGGVVSVEGRTGRAHTPQPSHTLETARNCPAVYLRFTASSRRPERVVTVSRVCRHLLAVVVVWVVVVVWGLCGWMNGWVDESGCLCVCACNPFLSVLSHGPFSLGTQTHRDTHRLKQSHSSSSSSMCVCVCTTTHIWMAQARRSSSL